MCILSPLDYSRTWESSKRDYEGQKDKEPYLMKCLKSNDTLSVENLKFTKKRFPQDGFCQGKMINGIYYLTFNKEETIKQMKDYIFN